MRIVFDDRERELIRQYNKTCDVRHLDVGDIQFYDDENHLLLIIERKTATDLKSSIHDGRYHEQKSRLLQCGLPRFQILYLFEGNLYGNCLSACIHTMYRDGIPVYRSKNILDTIAFLECVSETLEKWAIYQHTSVTSVNDTVTEPIFLKKKKSSHPLTGYIVWH